MPSTEEELEEEEEEEDNFGFIVTSPHPMLTLQTTVAPGRVECKIDIRRRLASSAIGNAPLPIGNSG